MKRFIATAVCILILMPVTAVYAQLSSSNYQIDNYRVGTVESNNSYSTNYQVDYDNDGTYYYGDPDPDPDPDDGGGGGIITDPDPVDPDPVDPDPVDPDPVDPDPVDPDPIDPDPVDPDPVTPPDDSGSGGGGGGDSDSGSDSSDSGGTGTLLVDQIDDDEKELTPVEEEVPKEVAAAPIARALAPVRKALSTVQPKKIIESVTKKVTEATPEAVAKRIEPAVTTVKKVSESDSVEAATVTSGLLLTLLALLRVPFSLSNFAHVITHVLSNLFGLFAFSKRRRPWGTVYDSVSKYPLDPAYVELFDEQGESVATAITDLDGRYGFVVPEGKYHIVAKKSNYSFPSKRRSLTSTDVLYTNPYYGAPVTIKGTVALNIPMDPVAEDWNQLEKLRTKQMRFIHRLDPLLVRIFSILFYAGILLSIWQVFAAPGLVSYSLFGLYVVLLVVRIKKGGPMLYGMVERGDMPLPFSVVRIMSGPAEIANKVTDEYGRYVSIVPPGTYRVVVDERKSQDTYETVYNSIKTTKKGIINEKISV